MTDRVMAQARSIFRGALPELFKRPNVTACGLGYKIAGEEETKELSIVVSVTRKLPRERLAESELVPQCVDSLPTDVIQTGPIRAHAALNPKEKYRPIQPGISIGHPEVTAGTFGYLVARAGERFILSNNHILANCNIAKRGDPILQPGMADLGTVEDRVAALSEFVPLDFGEVSGNCDVAESFAQLLNTLAEATGSRHRLRSVQVTPGENVMDAALARIDAPDDVPPDILNLGPPTGIVEPQLGMRVQKMGRSSGLTTGTVTQIDVAVNVDFEGQTARFVDQIMTSKMSSPGDSGSAVLDEERRATGLLFAGSDKVMLFTPIQRILSHFDVTLVM
jgi:hypothetical protein